MLRSLALLFSLLLIPHNAQQTTSTPGTTSLLPCPSNPLTAINTSSGLAQQITSDRQLQTSNCNWTLTVDDSNGYFELLDHDYVTMWTSEAIQSKTEKNEGILELTVAGNLRFEDNSADILWETDTTNAGTRPYNLSIENNGNVYLRDDTNTELWSLYCENNKPFMSSYEELRENEIIYSSICVYQLTLEGYDIVMRYYDNTNDFDNIPNNDNYTVLYKYTSDSVNVTQFIEPFVMAIDDDGSLGVKDASNTYLWQVSKKHKKTGAAPYFLRVQDDGEIAVYDSLERLLWDSTIDTIAHSPDDEVLEILLFSLYFSFFVFLMLFQLFRVAYLTRNSKNYTRDSEAGAMQYTKRSEIRTKLAETMTLGGPETAGGPTKGGGDTVDELLLGPDAVKSDEDDVKGAGDDDGKDADDAAASEDDSIRTSGDEMESKEELKSEDDLAETVAKKRRQSKLNDTQARLVEASKKGFKFMSIDHWRRWKLVVTLFADMIFVSMLHFLCNATSYAILLRWVMANFGSDSMRWRPENISTQEFTNCTYILAGILLFYHINSAVALRLNYRDTFYGLANKREVTYLEQRTMRNVFYQQLADLRVLREVRSSAMNEQASQFFPDIARTKYAVSCVPQAILFLYYIMRVEEYDKTWLVVLGLSCQLLYILVNNITTDDEVFSTKASQRCPPTPGFIARVLFRVFEITSRVAVFGLAAVVVHWTGVVILLCYHITVNFLFYQGSLLGKDPWNIVYFIITVADIGLVSRRREIDHWVIRPVKFLVHSARAMTCFIATASLDSMFHCVRLDEQLLFDFMFGRFIESMSELALIFYLASWHEDGFLPPTDQEGTLLFLAVMSSFAFLMFFFILRVARQFDHNRSSHRNALELARDGRWAMLSDYIPLYTEQEINRKDRFGDRTTILIYASEERQTKIVMQLLDRECDTSITDRRGNTALHKAAKNGRIDILEALIAADSDVNQANNRGWTPLHVACKEKHAECVEKLVEAGAAPLATMSENLTCIGVAMRFGSLEIVKYLLKQIKVTHYTDDQLNGAMEHVQDCEDFGGPLVHALHYGESKTAKILLECRVQNVNAQDHFGETALHKTCSWGYTKIAKELIRTYDCDVNIISDKGYSPFHIAVARQFPRIVDLLVDEGATVDFPTIKFAEKVLLKVCVTGYYNIFEHVIKLADKMDIDARDLDGNSCLLLAAQNKNTKICRNLIKAGVDVTSRNMWGKSIFDTKLPDNLREAVDYVLKVQSGLIAVHGDQGVTPGMEMVTPGLGDDKGPGGGPGAGGADDEEPGIMGLDDNGPKKKKIDEDDVLVPESQGILGWGPGGGPGAGPGA